MRDGYQSELLIIIAENQPILRSSLKELFSGGDEQFKNALHNLRQNGKVALLEQGYELTDSGVNKAKLAVIESAKKARKPEKTWVLPMPGKNEESLDSTKEGGEFRPASGVTMKVKIMMLQQLHKIPLLSPEIRHVLGCVESDLMELERLRG